MGLHDLWAGDAPLTVVPNHDTASVRSSTTSPKTSLPPRPSKTTAASPGEAADQSDSVSVSSQHSASSSDPITALIPQHACLDSDQIARDVARCTWHLLSGTLRLQRLQMEHKRNRRVAKLIRKKQQRLARLINVTLLQSYRTNTLRYYQGYHDVACIVLSTLGGVSGLPVQAHQGTDVAASDTDLASAVLLRISGHHLRDCLQTNFVPLQTALRCTIFPLIAVLDPAVHAHLYQCDMEPFFALSWVLTWFAHEVRDTQTVKRLFDAFLVSHALLPIYMSVAMVIHPTNRQEILECECDFSLLHQTLRGLPKNSSMVGWKYRPGDGYVSDDEKDDGTVSTMESAGTTDAEILIMEKLDHEHHHKNVNEPQQREDHTASLVSSSNLSLMEPPAPVSFEELLDQSMEMMRRIPPRKLLGLAKRYYGAKQVEQMLAQCDIIYMFENDLPCWMFQGSAKADWVYRLEARERKVEGRDRKAIRKERKRNRSRSPSLTRSASPSTMAVQDSTLKEDLQFIKENSNVITVVALGLGPGDDEERRRRKRRKRTIAIVVVALLAVTIGVVLRYEVSATTDSVGNVPSSIPIPTLNSATTVASTGKESKSPPLEASVLTAEPQEVTESPEMIAEEESSVSASTKDDDDSSRSVDDEKTSSPDKEQGDSTDSDTYEGSAAVAETDSESVEQEHLSQAQTTDDSFQLELDSMGDTAEEDHHQGPNDELPQLHNIVPTEDSVEVGLYPVVNEQSQSLATVVSLIRKAAARIKTFSDSVQQRGLKSQLASLVERSVNKARELLFDRQVCMIPNLLLIFRIA